MEWRQIEIIQTEMSEKSLVAFPTLSKLRVTGWLELRAILTPAVSTDKATQEVKSTEESGDVGFKWFRGGREICWSGGGKLWAGWGLWSYLSAAVAQPSFLIQRNPPPHNSHLTIHPVFSHHIVIQSQIEAQVS